MPRETDRSVWHDGLNEISISTVLPMPPIARAADQSETDPAPATKSPTAEQGRETTGETWRRSA